VSRLLGALSWPEVQGWRDAVLAIPLGATEQHGPHLPLDTDTEIAIGLARAVSASGPTAVLVAPPLPFGSSGEHGGFPGTLSIGQAATELLVVELVRSAARSFDRIVLVCAHGGNLEPVARAADRLRSDGHRVLAWFPRWPTDSHAGHDETSLMLALRPDRVRLEHLQAGAGAPLSELWPHLRAHGVRAVSANGVLGDPRRASAAAGRALLQSAARDLRRRIEDWLDPS